MSLLIVCVLGPALAHGQLEERRVVLDDRVHLRDMELCARPQHARHVTVDLDDQALGRAGDLRRVVVADAERHVAVPVHRRDRADEALDADLLGQQPGRLMKMVRNVQEHLAVVLAAPLDQGAVGGGSEHAAGLDTVDQLVVEHAAAGDRGRLHVVELQRLRCRRPAPARRGLAAALAARPSPCPSPSCCSTGWPPRPRSVRGQLALVDIGEIHVGPLRRPGQYPAASSGEWPRLWISMVRSKLITSLPSWFTPRVETVTMPWVGRLLLSRLCSTVLSA